MDAGLALVPDPTYEALIWGLQQNIFIKSGNKDRAKMDETSPIKNLNGTLYGRVWPGYAAFPDFIHPNGSNYWINELSKFEEIIDFDGLWIDMNEIANFCVGACIPEDWLPFENSVLNQVIYTPGEVDLEEHSISLDGVHFDGNTELDYHSLFGYLQGKSTS